MFRVCVRVRNTTSGSTQLYVDGTLFGSKTCAVGSGAENTQLLLGDNSGASDQYGNFWLENFRFWALYNDDVSFISYDMSHV